MAELDRYYVIFFVIVLNIYLLRCCELNDAFRSIFKMVCDWLEQIHRMQTNQQVEESRKENRRFYMLYAL